MIRRSLLKISDDSTSTTCGCLTACAVAAYAKGLMVSWKITGEGMILLQLPHSKITGRGLY
ncbi:hypothetical protein CY34DRAFT_806022 [Suillus luteus UH-Slu-Lm8-n1]|uniref:Uncharacterized protein n=1 Tax=Suillus luteus UH-Slu-Lm8-n1 TaxID=930992 RepID=A0A0D0AI62_9AGAM|nr:hypothetical protein CY34DRAFT_806022 [Suillus luteus UH-Slu-Lm8-n1]